MWSLKKSIVNMDEKEIEIDLFKRAMYRLVNFVS